MALQVADPAPDFVLPASTGGSVSLRDLRGRKVVLYFYPRDDTPGCTKEACDFRDANAELRAAGIEVLGVSKNTVKSHLKFIDKFKLPFTLLADVDHAVADAYGVWGEKKYIGRTYVGMNRMTFLIDEVGRIAHIWPKVSPLGHATDVLRTAKSAARPQGKGA